MTVPKEAQPQRPEEAQPEEAQTERPEEAQPNLPEEAQPKLWEGPALSVNDYNIDFENALGFGASATVYYANRRQAAAVAEDAAAVGEHDASAAAEDVQPQEIVFKVIELATDEDSAAKELAMLKSEVAILTDMQGHPNIIGFYGACVVCRGSVQRQSALQMEYCAGGDIVSAVSRGRFPEDQAHSVMRELLGALTHIHSRGVVHRDVKPENILMVNEEHNTVKLTDFGISARLNDSVAMEKRCGSPGYVAPEIWLADKYDIKVDTFSTGALLYFIISGRGAFSGSCLKSVMTKTINAPLDFRKSVCLERLSDGCKEFMKTLLEKEPRFRPTACKALAEIWRLLPDIDTTHRRDSELDRLTFCSDRMSSKRSVLSSGRNSYVDGHEPILARSELEDLSVLDELQPEKPRNPMPAVRSIRACSRRTDKVTAKMPESPQIDSEDARLLIGVISSVLSSGRNSHVEGHEQILTRSELEEISNLSEFQPSKPKKPMPAHPSPAMKKYQSRLEKLR